MRRGNLLLPCKHTLYLHSTLKLIYMKRLLTFSCAALLSCTALWAQSSQTSRKWDGRIESLMKRQSDTGTASAPSFYGQRTQSDTTLHVIITADDASALGNRLSAEGYRATVINEHTLTARLPLHKVAEVGGIASTRFISSSRRHRRFMKKAREAVGADRVHKGTDLKTPYTGKGVVVAVIDQGFQFNHAAFLDPTTNASRIMAMWNRHKGENPVFGPLSTTDKKYQHDGMTDAGGHGTHVAGIAAGSDRGNGYYGMAPGADIILIPSEFDDAELLEDVHFIDSVATAQHKPWVTNMSFGSTVGPHDGTRDYDVAMNTIMSRGAGRVITAAVGNDAESKVHAYHKFTTDNDTVYLLFEPETGEIGDNGQPVASETENLYFEIWGNGTDSTQHLQVTPFVHDEDVDNGPTLKLSTDYKAAYDSIWGPYISENNKRECYEFWGNCDKVFKGMSAPIVVVEIVGNKGDEFHAWIGDGFGKIIPYTDQYQGVKPDNDYCVGEGAASIPGAIAVGAFTSATSWTDYNGRPASFEDSKEVEGNVANFSSHGPWLGAEMKPSVLGPGTAISSAINRYDEYYKANLKINEITSKISTQNGQRKVYHYYGVMEGSSMASPAVAGIVALWLEANPNLTYQDVADIIRTTSVKHADMGGAVWEKRYGYGKINAYEGLKAALSKVTGIAAVHRSATPVTVQTEAEAVRLLFGSVEKGVSYQLYTLSGTLVKSGTLDHVMPGTEAVIATSSLPTGVYLLRITTPASTTTIKVMR